MQRFRAVEAVAAHNDKEIKSASVNELASDHFGMYVFTRSVMQKMLPPDIYQNVDDAMERKDKIRQEYADTIAVAMKEWSISLGATHFTHWFQPLTGTSAEKHDAFIEWLSPDRMMEQFTGKQLIQGEPDASSFPSGGLRSTFEARGYTGWDPASPAFVWKEGDGITLFIPSVFFSWTGDVLDSKIPLNRSEKKINDATLRLLKLTGIEASRVHTTIGLEQEYFVIDRSFHSLRPDLVLCGRTVFGAPSPKGQELQDHYFGSVKERILCFMHDFERAAIRLGIPVKTRHNEVAPAQHEVVPVVERASLAIDHNIQLMELMRKIAIRHKLSVLLHEKPFDELNGSGKHCNWSLATDTGINLLDPTGTPENHLHFVVLLTAIMHAVHQYSVLLRASIGSASNDRRLGGHEAPPAIISVYLGETLEQLLTNIEKHGVHKSDSKKCKYDLGIRELPDLNKENTDRNRTSPFAFTGNKFEFRALGSSVNPSMSVTVLNAVVAVSLNEMLDVIEKKLKGKRSKNREELIDVVMPVVRKYLKNSRPIRFSGDSYSKEWVKEAEKRGLPNIEKAIDSYKSLIDKNTIKAFDGLLTSQELKSRYKILAENYALSVNIEVNLMKDLFSTQVLPAALKQQKQMADSLSAFAQVASKIPLNNQKTRLLEFVQLVEKAITQEKVLSESQDTALKSYGVKRTEIFCKKVIPEMDQLREIVDQIETLVDDQLWTLPKYRELLFLV